MQKFKFYRIICLFERFSCFCEVFLIKNLIDFNRQGFPRNSIHPACDRRKPIRLYNQIGRHPEPVDNSRYRQRIDSRKPKNRMG